MIRIVAYTVDIREIIAVRRCYIYKKTTSQSKKLTFTHKTCDNFIGQFKKRKRLGLTHRSIKYVNNTFKLVHWFTGLYYVVKIQILDAEHRQQKPADRLRPVPLTLITSFTVVRS